MRVIGAVANKSCESDRLVSCVSGKQVSKEGVQLTKTGYPAELLVAKAENK